MARSCYFAFLITFLCIRSSFSSTDSVNECKEDKVQNYFQKVWYKGYVPSVMGINPKFGYHDIRFYFNTNEATLIDTPNIDTRENLIYFQRSFKCENPAPKKFQSNSNISYKDGFPTLYENLLDYIPNQYFRVPKASLARYLLFDFIKKENGFFILKHFFTFYKYTYEFNSTS